MKFSDIRDNTLVDMMFFVPVHLPAQRVKTRSANLNTLDTVLLTSLGEICCFGTARIIVQTVNSSEYFGEN